ncbi:uncharacterized protein [Eschrichtius robustus]|uniref:uncharacterized protein isoform X2 n=1 Tax=Eschrichtius robustus TaxID=9764 RepID=UPI0035C0ACFD
MSDKSYHQEHVSRSGFSLPSRGSRNWNDLTHQESFLHCFLNLCYASARLPSVISRHPSAACEELRDTKFNVDHFLPSSDFILPDTGNKSTSRPLCLPQKARRRADGRKREERKAAKKDRWTRGRMSAASNVAPFKLPTREPRAPVKWPKEEKGKHKEERCHFYQENPTSPESPEIFCFSLIILLLLVLGARGDIHPLLTVPVDFPVTAGEKKSSQC